MRAGLRGLRVRAGAARFFLVAMGLIVLRRNRESLVRILTLCQEGDESDGLLRDVKFEANNALGFYDTETK